MILLADLGNSRIKWATWEAGHLQQRGQSSHDEQNWARLAEQQWRELSRPTHVYIVSVAGPEACSTLSCWVRQVWGIEAQFVISSAVACGVHNAYADPERLGADRWVALIAAHALLIGQDCYVVDCGTAITIDALAAHGRHLGGVIVPGIRLMREALYRETRQIPPEMGKARLFGQSTRDGVWGGAMYTVASAIDGIIGRMIADHGAGIRLLTGGDAEAVLPYLQAEYRWEPDLIFTGLQVIAQSQAD
ncbi:MAG: type III pantothenate kinase [Gammaproteobacteria bacterium]|nr:type III pantothenate kinase [Gammaproteobacteria bacterium]